MAKLVLKRFQCAEDTNEIGGESPYFITWVGNLDDVAQSTLTLTAKTYWDNNVFKGPGAWPVDHVVCAKLPASPSKALALAVMVEKDNGRDITSSELTDMKSKMQDALSTWVQSGVFDSNANANFVNTMRNTFEALVVGKLKSAVGDDDDLMQEDGYRASRRITLTGKAEELDIVTFKGDDGEYHVRYARV